MMHTLAEMTNRFTDDLRMVILACIVYLVVLTPLVLLFALWPRNRKKKRARS